MIIYIKFHIIINNYINILLALLYPPINLSTKNKTHPTIINLMHHKHPINHQQDQKPYITKSTFMVELVTSQPISSCKRVKNKEMNSVGIKTNSN